MDLQQKLEIDPTFPFSLHPYRITSSFFIHRACCLLLVVPLPCCMIRDNISEKEKINLLSRQIYELTGDKNFKMAKGMGEIMKASFDYISRNYENHEMLSID